MEESWLETDCKKGVCFVCKEEADVKTYDSDYMGALRNGIYPGKSVELCEDCTDFLPGCHDYKSILR